MKNKIKKECLIISIIFLFIGLSASSSGVNIENINTRNPNICHNGTILYVGGSGEDNYTRIQYAINDANPGDIVFVYDDSSPYYECIVIDKSINLIGEDKNDTVIDGSKKGKVVLKVWLDKDDYNDEIDKDDLGALFYERTVYTQKVNPILEN